jgi:Flp pilus assembly protein protease CpaA
MSLFPLRELAELSEPAQILVRAAATAWMLAVAAIDHRTGRIPNSYTAPVMLGVGALRLAEGFFGQPERFLLLAAWAGIFGLWTVHFIGGGDAKFLMGLYALFPSMEFTAVLAFLLLIITGVLFLRELRGRPLAALGRGLRDRVITGQVMPTEAELHERGRRYAWTFAIPAIVYTWRYW